MISIIIPVFNAEKTIEKALDSVISQTYTDIQLIVIDGLSTDGTIDVLTKFSNKIDHLIIEKDQGVYSAMNKGIGLAKGDFLYFLGADDFLDNKDVFTDLFSEGIDESIQLVFGNVRNVGATSAKIPLVHQAEFSYKLYLKNTIHHQGTFYNRSVFENFRYDESLQVLADYELNIILLNKKAKSVKKTIVVATCLAQGVSKKFNAPLYQEELKLKKRQLSSLGYLFQIPWVWLKYLYKQL